MKYDIELTKKGKRIHTKKKVFFLIIQFVIIYEEKIIK